jgi:signal transduction histidine kinase
LQGSAERSHLYGLAAVERGEVGRELRCRVIPCLEIVVKVLVSHAKVVDRDGSDVLARHDDIENIAGRKPLDLDAPLPPIPIQPVTEIGLTDLLAQNQRLGARVRRAATGATARNERFLRRISAELHDGPAQALGLALLRLDSVAADAAESVGDKATPSRANADLDIIQSSLRDALDEIRAISSGLVLPELGELSLRQTLVRVSRFHERRTETEVALELDGVPGDVSLPLKITVYRFVQEALANAYRHAGGRGQKVWVSHETDRLRIQVSDLGTGFEWNDREQGDEHLGLEGMRQRVESIGGTFRIQSGLGLGTQVVAELPLDLAVGEHAQ